MIQRNLTSARNHDRTALVVEPSDALYFQIATILIQSGYRVTRAKTGWSAVNAALSQTPSLLIANATLPDQSGWLMTKKLQLTDPTCCVWIYKSFCTARDRAMAKFLGLAWLINYRGVAGELSQLIGERVVDDRSCDRRVIRQTVPLVPAMCDVSSPGLALNRFGYSATEVA